MPNLGFRCLIREMHQFEGLPGRELAIVREISAAQLTASRFRTPARARAAAHSRAFGLSISETHRRRHR